MQRRTVDALIAIGIPANLKGFHYICDAIELFDSDKYWLNGKITALYSRIAAINGTTDSSVERAIRHAFKKIITRGNPEAVTKYLSTKSCTNSSLLKTLYLRLKEEELNETLGFKQMNQEIISKLHDDLNPEVNPVVIYKLVSEMHLVLTEFLNASVYN